MATFRDLLNQTKAEIREVDTAEAEELAGQPGAVVLDVREPDEYEQGAIPGSLHIPRGHLESNIEGRVPDHDTPLVVYCAGGIRSAFAAKTLERARLHRRRLGRRAASTSGRTRAATGGRRASLTPEQRNRYQRHLLLPEVGEEGQLKLLDAKVLLLGAGGLGSPAALYLAAAGVGTIGIIDMDVVDESNLQRQILHNMDRIGDRKVDSAKKTLTALNPDVNVVTHDVRLGADNVVRHPQRLRPRRRRHRQLPDPLPGQRRVGEARHPGRARLDLPLRGHGHRLRPRRRARPTATWSPSRRRPSWRRRAPRPACSACCPASSGRSRPSRPSS